MTFTAQELIDAAARLHDECWDSTFRRGLTMLCADLLYPHLDTITAQHLVIEAINNTNHPRLF